MTPADMMMIGPFRPRITNPPFPFLLRFLAGGDSVSKDESSLFLEVREGYTFNSLQGMSLRAIEESAEKRYLLIYMMMEESSLTFLKGQAINCGKGS